jgi:endonuclease YncB( thermonuclease family)
MMRYLSTALVIVLLCLAPAAQAQDQRCFPETGQCISGRIQQYWEQNGGLPVFGFPTTDQHEELVEGRPFQVQWFERNRLELHPENQRPYDVLLGRLGVDRLAQQGRDWFSFPKGGEQSGCRHFAETGHTLCGAFLSYFRAHGLDLGQPGIAEAESLALFGLPISEATDEVSATDGKTYLTQHFERARMELHPENSPPFDVLLGLLGNEIRAGGAPPPIAVTQPAGLPTAAVVEVIDGDTVDVRLNGEIVRIRLIGIDTPEVLDPRRPVECFGREASAMAHALLDGQTVALEADASQDDRDRYGRLLRYLWLPDSRLFNLEMIAQGYAFEYTYNTPYNYQQPFKQAERAAREAQRGLWSPQTCNGEHRPADGAPAPTAVPAGNCDPSYPDVCIPPPPPDLDCPEISYRNFRVLPPDPHRFDRDKDGIGCET